MAKHTRTATLIALMLLVSSAGGALGGTGMPTSGRTIQPIGHYEFCQRLPDECKQRTASRRPVELSGTVWAEMVAVNNGVNTKVTPRTDMEIWGKPEVWSFPDKFGDCEDFALEKRRELIADGIPAGSLLITVVRQANGNGHAVLTVRTSDGDYILDNLQPRILAWQDTDYTFLKRQSVTNSGDWVSINDGRTVAVGSVK